MISVSFVSDESSKRLEALKDVEKKSVLRGLHVSDGRGSVMQGAGSAIA